ncbi:hypothetical protein AB0I22_14875 [Streptomyces sp. NPDC050610]|uniref:hypothetical protein n=1 Tax=Streptomyces sp. NPDC050610 TaxID=3157097 RepID=UPI00342E5139
MKSAARAELSRLMAESGGTGVLLLFKPLGDTLDRPEIPPGSIAFPRCECPQHRAGAGVPDTAVRLGARGAANGGGREGATP